MSVFNNNYNNNFNSQWLIVFGLTFFWLVVVPLALHFTRIDAEHCESSKVDVFYVVLSIFWLLIFVLNIGYSYYAGQAVGNFPRIVHVIICICQSCWIIAGFKWMSEDTSSCSSEANSPMFGVMYLASLLGITLFAFSVALNPKASEKTHLLNFASPACFYTTVITGQGNPNVGIVVAEEEEDIRDSAPYKPILAHDSVSSQSTTH